MTLDPSALSNFTLIGTGFAAAFLAALWLSLIIWTYRDIRSRARDPLARVLAILVVAVLFLPGVLIYLIVRPAQTIEQEYQHTLEEEALLQSIEEIPVCPGCGRRVPLICITVLKRFCGSSAAGISAVVGIAESRASVLSSWLNRSRRETVN